MTTKWNGAKDWFQLRIDGALVKEGEDIGAELCILARQYGQGAVVESVKHPIHGYAPFGFHFSAPARGPKLRAEIERAKVVNARVFKVLATAQEQNSLDVAFSYLRRELNPNYWLVGMGGHHVWIKRADRPSVRVAVVRESVPS